MTETAIQPAGPQLLELARAMRPDWDPDVLSAALIAAKTAGWTWTRTFTETARLLTDEQAGPLDLKRAAASPFQVITPPPGTGAKGAAACRAALAAAQRETAPTR